MMLRPSSFPAFALALLGAGLFSGPTPACTPVPLVDLAPEKIVKTATAVHLGKVRKVDRDHDRLVLIVTVSETLRGNAVSELRVSLPIMPMCGLPGVFETDDNVVVVDFRSTNQGESLLLPYRYSPTVYLPKLRAHIRESQSNSTVEGDARKSGTRPSP